jgi:hypothetical protein
MRVAALCMCTVGRGLPTTSPCLVGVQEAKEGNVPFGAQPSEALRQGTRAHASSTADDAPAGAQAPGQDLLAEADAASVGPGIVLAAQAAEAAAVLAAGPFLWTGEMTEEEATPAHALYSDLVQRRPQLGLPALLHTRTSRQQQKLRRSVTTFTPTG